jgi:arginyl-tRNA synthetase
MVLSVDSAASMLMSHCFDQRYGIAPDKAAGGVFYFLLKAKTASDPACSFLFARAGMNPLIVQKTDGGFGYHASDLACIK